MKLIKHVAYISICIFMASCSFTESNNIPVTSSSDDAPKEVNEVENETPKYTYGIDISSHQGTEINSLKKDSLSFIIARASDGITFQDADFQGNWETALDKGFIRGAYHFFRSDDDAEKQIDNYLSTVGGFSKDDLPPIIDFEGAGIDTSQTDAQIVEVLVEALQYLEGQTKRTPIIYVDVSNANRYLTNEEFASYTLWIADYESVGSPEMAGVWKDESWVLWQESSDYLINGMKNDFDLFNGDLNQLKSFINKN